MSPSLSTRGAITAGFGRWSCVRILAALVLLAAAVMKTAQLATVPVLGEGLFHARWFVFCLIEFELGFALWLLAGPYPKPTRLAVIALFSVFGLVSLYKALSGEASCGCFGAAKVDPRFTAALDAALATLAVLFPPKTVQAVPTPKKFALGLVVWALAGVPVVLAALSTRTEALSALGRVHISSNGRRTIELEPDKWTGGAIPILSHIEPAEVRRRLEEGTWTVLFFQRDCLDCQGQIRTLARQRASDTDGDIVCVELPPYGDRTALPAGPLYVRLSDQYDWYIETPALFSAVRLR